MIFVYEYSTVLYESYEENTIGGTYCTVQYNILYTGSDTRRKIHFKNLFPRFRIEVRVRKISFSYDCRTIVLAQIIARNTVEGFSAHHRVVIISSDVD